MKIAVDMDGTCVNHIFPEMGEDVPHAAEVMKELVEAGHKLILYTMRSGKELDAAVQWFADKDIPLYSVQKDKGQLAWTKSNKCYANKYVDDSGIGCPLIKVEGWDRPCVDWEAVRAVLLNE